jgi:hypothetical protein
MRTRNIWASMDFERTRLDERGEIILRYVKGCEVGVG